MLENSKGDLGIISGEKIHIGNELKEVARRQLRHSVQRSIGKYGGEKEKNQSDTSRSLSGVKAHAETRGKPSRSHRL